MRTAGYAIVMIVLTTLMTSPLSAADDPAEVARAFFEKVWSEGDVELAHGIINADFQFHNPMIRIVGPTGPDLVTGRVEMIREAFPDYKIEVLDIFSEGPKVLVRWKAAGTHEGPLGGNEPTGKSMSYEGMTVLEIHNGQIYEEWTIDDFRSGLRQLGIESLQVRRQQ
ncbi:MAG TPA: ester cyclase [Acidobacteriota bacterium]|nr:ester cyclase [Acidobacteriota bacterium]